MENNKNDNEILMDKLSELMRTMRRSRREGAQGMGEGFRGMERPDGFPPQRGPDGFPPHGPGEHPHGPGEHPHGPGEHPHGPGEHQHGPSEHQHGPGEFPPPPRDEFGPCCMARRSGYNGPRAGMPPFGRDYGFGEYGRVNPRFGHGPAMPPPPPGFDGPFTRDHRPPHGRERALRILADEGDISQQKLAGILAIRPQSLSELLAKLENDGYITRRRNDADRRETIVSLTESGKSRAAEFGYARRRQADDMLSPLSDDERATLLTLITKLLDAQNAPDGKSHAPEPAPDCGVSYAPEYTSDYSEAPSPADGNAYTPESK